MGRGGFGAGSTPLADVSGRVQLSTRHAVLVSPLLGRDQLPAGRVCFVCLGAHTLDDSPSIGHSVAYTVHFIEIQSISCVPTGRQCGADLWLDPSSLTNDLWRGSCRHHTHTGHHVPAACRSAGAPMSGCV